MVWNKGLTKETDERVKQSSLSRMGNKNPHYGKPNSKTWYKVMIGKPSWNKNIPMTEEAKENLRKVNTGKILTINTKEKISIGIKNNLPKSVFVKNDKRLIGNTNGFKLGSTPWIKDRINPFTTKQLNKIKEARAKQILPLEDTRPEVIMQNYLKNLNIEFIPHKYMNILHGYQCDIFIPSKNLVIECDGDFIHCNPLKYSKDFL